MTEKKHKTSDEEAMIKNKETPIEKAVEFLKLRLKEIDRVGEWARAMGYKNEKRFSLLFRNCHGKRPKKTMDQMKARKAIELLSDDNEMSCYEVAREIGKRDEHALFHYIVRMTGHPPRYFSKRIK